MPLSRYYHLDEYTLEELKFRYRISDAKNRIELIKELQAGHTFGSIPDEIALLAVEDPIPEVRGWFARHGLAHDEVFYRLRNDPDPFIRASLLENPHYSSVAAPLVDNYVSAMTAMFPRLTQMERLALMRNPRVSHTLTEKVLDPDDKYLNLDMGSRRDLAIAWIYANAGRPRDYEEKITFSKKLWFLAAKWPLSIKLDSGEEEGSYFPATVYEYVDVDDDTKAEHYRECKHPALRQCVLKNCTKNVDDITLNLGLHDSDEECRELARSIIGEDNSLTLKAKTYGMYALKGLAYLITLALIYLMFWKFSAPFETALFAVVVIALVGIRGFYLNWRETTLYEWIALDRNLRLIGDHLLKTERNQQMRRKEESFAQGLQKSYREAEVQADIESILFLLIIAYALFKLVMALEA
jgi:hypothetical protein